LKDLYSAENQLVKALLKMAKAATSDKLRQGFQEHLGQTKEQVKRLEAIFELLDENAWRKKCKGMEGLIAGGSEITEEDFAGAVLDARLIGAAQRVEHYQIAAYRTARAFAEELGNPGMYPSWSYPLQGRSYRRQADEAFGCDQQTG
jgi:ferritin-like metal-binding protein YciE